MGRTGLLITHPPKIISKIQTNVKNIQKPKSLALQLKGVTTVGKTVYFGFTPAQIQKKEQEKLNKNLKNLNLKK